MYRRIFNFVAITFLWFQRPYRRNFKIVALKSIGCWTLLWFWNSTAWSAESMSFTHKVLMFSKKKWSIRRSKSCSHMRYFCRTHALNCLFVRRFLSAFLCWKASSLFFSIICSKPVVSWRGGEECSCFPSMLTSADCTGRYKDWRIEGVAGISGWNSWRFVVQRLKQERERIQDAVVALWASVLARRKQKHYTERKESVREVTRLKKKFGVMKFD